MQVPHFGAFYPPAQDPHPEGRKRRRQVDADARRPVLSKIKCLRPGYDKSASWDAPELVDNDEPAGSTALRLGAPDPVALQQQQAPPADSQQALPGQQDAAEALKQSDSVRMQSASNSTSAASMSVSQPPVLFQQPGISSGQPWSQHTAVAQGGAKQQDAAIPSFGQAAGASGAPLLGAPAGFAAVTKDSSQPKAAAGQFSFAPQPPTVNPAMPNNNQQAYAAPSTAAAPASFPMPGQGAPGLFQQGPTAKPEQQQPGLFFGQPAQQVRVLFTVPC